MVAKSMINSIKKQKQAMEYIACFTVAPLGIEPRPRVPETLILSIKLWGRLGRQI